MAWAFANALIPNYPQKYPRADGSTPPVVAIKFLSSGPSI